MLEILLRLSLLALFVLLSFGIGPAIFPMSSFLAFLLVCIFTQIHKNDLRQYVYIIIYGIIADVMIGVAFGVHALAFTLCAILSYISSHKITAQRRSSKVSLIVSSIAITLIATLLYEITRGNLEALISNWKSLLSVVLGVAILYLPLMISLEFIEKRFGEFLQARNYKKHH